VASKTIIKGNNLDPLRAICTPKERRKNGDYRYRKIQTIKKKNSSIHVEIDIYNVGG